MTDTRTKAEKVAFDRAHCQPQWRACAVFGPDLARDGGVPFELARLYPTRADVEAGDPFSAGDFHLLGRVVIYRDRDTTTAPRILGVVDEPGPTAEGPEVAREVTFTPAAAVTTADDTWEARTSKPMLLGDAWVLETNHRRDLRATFSPPDPPELVGWTESAVVRTRLDALSVASIPLLHVAIVLGFAATLTVLRRRSRRAFDITLLLFVPFLYAALTRAIIAPANHDPSPYEENVTWFTVALVLGAVLSAPVFGIARLVLRKRAKEIGNLRILGWTGFAVCPVAILLVAFVMSVAYGMGHM